MSTTETTTLSSLLAACERAYKTIQDTHSDVPDAVVVIGSGGRRSATLLGHFAVNCWAGNTGSVVELHEVLIVAEQLHRSGEDVFTTLLHEAVHGIATTRGIKDVAGKRHNKKFAALCIEVGLTPPSEPHATLGYSEAILSSEAVKEYQATIDEIDYYLRFIRKLNLEKKTTRKTTWMAKCECERSVRIPKKTIEDPENLEIMCGNCGSAFNLTEEDLDDFNEQASGD